MIQRYTFAPWVYGDVAYDGPDTALEKATSGPFGDDLCKWRDVEALIQELARANEERERLTKELEEARKPKPISTAPKGGKWCLLWWPEITNEWVIGYRVEGYWHSITGHEEWSPFPGPELWMPLPRLPALSQLSNKGEAG